jgi:hypothetical protein
VAKGLFLRAAKGAAEFAVATIKQFWLIRLRRVLVNVIAAGAFGLLLLAICPAEKAAETSSGKCGRTKPVRP